MSCYNQSYNIGVESLKVIIVNRLGTLTLILYLSDAKGHISNSTLYKGNINISNLLSARGSKYQWADIDALC